MKRVAVAGFLLGVLGMLFPARLALLGTLELVVRPHVGAYHMTGKNDQYWEFIELAAQLRRVGWTTKLFPLPKGWYGITCTQDNRMNPFGPCAQFEEPVILVNEALAWNDRYSTLAHEGAHTLQPDALTKGQEEQFAEAVSALVTGRYLEPAHYLAGYRADVLTLLAWQGDIYEAVRRLQP